MDMDTVRTQMTTLKNSFKARQAAVKMARLEVTHAKKMLSALVEQFPEIAQEVGVTEDVDVAVD